MGKWRWKLTDEYGTVCSLSLVSGYISSDAAEKIFKDSLKLGNKAKVVVTPYPGLENKSS